MKSKFICLALLITTIFSIHSARAQKTFFLTHSAANNSESTGNQMTVNSESWSLKCTESRVVNSDAGVCGAVVNYTPPGVVKNNSFTQTPSNILDATPGACVHNQPNLPSTEASYVRVYDFPSMGMPYGFSLNSVTFGVRWARSPSGGSHTIQVRVYSWDPSTPLHFNNFTYLSSASVLLSPQIRTYKTVPINAELPAGKALIVEIYVPDFSGTDFRFLMGATNGTESSHSYIKTPCTTNELMLLANSLTFPTYKWVIDVNGNYFEAAQQTEGLPPGSIFPVGTTINSFTMTNNGITSTCSFPVTVNDTEVPQIQNLATGITEIWPVNNKMVDVAVNYNVTDNCPGTTCEISSVTSNEPASGNGINGGSDWEIVNNNLVKVRASRLGTGNGRVYTINIRCTDAAGNTTHSSRNVYVPKSMGNNKELLPPSQLEIYPNPVKGTLNLKLGGVAGEHGQVILRDLQGRQLLQKQVVLTAPGQLLKLEIMHLSAGTFIIQWIKPSGSQSLHFVAQ